MKLSCWSVGPCKLDLHSSVPSLRWVRWGLMSSDIPSSSKCLLCRSGKNLILMIASLFWFYAFWGNQRLHIVTHAEPGSRAEWSDFSWVENFLKEMNSGQSTGGKSGELQPQFWPPLSIAVWFQGYCLVSLYPITGFSWCGHARSGYHILTLPDYAARTASQSHSHTGTVEGPWPVPGWSVAGHSYYFQQKTQSSFDVQRCAFLLPQDGLNSMLRGFASLFPQKCWFWSCFFDIHVPI